MKIYIGTDHNGFELKNELVNLLKRLNYDVADEGDEVLDPQDDYPVFAEKVVRAMQASDDPDPRGILICGSGQGMCIAANRFRGIRACLGHDREAARACRNDEDANVLCLPSRVLKGIDAELIVKTFLDTPFAGAARYIRRNTQLDELAA